MLKIIVRIIHGQIQGIKDILIFLNELQQFLFLLLWIFQINFLSSENFMYLIFQDGFWLVHIFHLVGGSKFNLLHNSQWTLSSILSYLVWYSFCDSLLYLICDESFHFLCIIYTYNSVVYYWFSLKHYWSLWLCAAIRGHSVSLLRFPFRSHVYIFSCEILLVCRLKYS